MEIGKEIARILLHFVTFGFCFYALSCLDLSKLVLPSKNRNIKAQLLLLLLSAGLGYLVAQFILAIMYNV